MEHFAQESFDDVNGQFLARDGGVGGDANQRAFQPADVGANPLRQEINDLVRQFRAHGFGLLAENGRARFDVRRLQIRDEAPFEARDEALLEILDFAGRAVAGQDDLFVPLVQGVEGMEKFLLDALLAGEELDVINEQDVRLAVFFAEAHELVVLNAVDVFVGEFFRRNIRHARALPAARDVLPDGVKQMRLAQADAAIQE